MSSKTEAVPVNFADTRVPSFEFDFEDPLQNDAVPGPEGRDLAGRSFVALVDSNAHPVSRAYEAGVSHTDGSSARSIAEHQDGTARIIQKSYWSQGVCTGIYYLFQYWFSLDAKNRSVLDTIYLAVQEAVASSEEVDINALSHSILSISCDDSVIQETMETHFAMVQHAFGYTGQAEELLLTLHNVALSTQRKDAKKLHFLNCLVMHMVGETLFSEAANNLLPKELRIASSVDHSCYQYLQDFVAKAKGHPFYNKLQLAYGEDPLCAEMIAGRALAIIKQNQFKYIDWLSTSGLLTDGGMGLRSELQHMHSHFDQFLALYSVHDEEGKKVLADLIMYFERGVTSFAMFATFVKENKITLNRLIERSLPQVVNILRFTDFEKLTTLLQMIEYADEQYILVVQKILEQFSKQDANFAPINVAEFFTRLESEIREENLVILIDVSSTEFLGEACFHGFDLIAHYLVPNMALIRDELIYWSILAKLLGTSKTNEGAAWNTQELANRMAPLLERFKLEPIISLLHARTDDCNRICGDDNCKTLLAYLVGLRQAIS